MKRSDFRGDLEQWLVQVEDCYEVVSEYLAGNATRADLIELGNNAGELLDELEH